MDAPRFLDLATRLLTATRSGTGLGVDGGLAECRSAVSRAYYAAFHHAAEYLGDLGFTLTEKGSCHKSLQFAHKTSGHTWVVILGAHLDTLYTERLSADYDLAVPRTESIAQAETVLGTAKQVITIIGNARAGSLKPPIDTPKVTATIAAKKATENWGKDIHRAYAS
jgi:uncharacterized protein (UPF0332 family)